MRTRAASDQWWKNAVIQWSDDPNGGFSTAAAEQLPARPPEGEYGPLAVNVSRQRRESDSLLHGWSL